MATILRERATAVLIRDGKVLLVQGPNLPGHHMPGGGIEGRETPEEAVVRELREETGLVSESVEFLFTWESSTNRHHAFMVEAPGEPALSDEVVSITWWDRRQELPRWPHVDAILSKLDVLTLR